MSSPAVSARAASARALPARALLPHRNAARVVCAASVLGAVLAMSPDARAFCRTRTCEFRRDPDASCRFDEETGCSTVGEFVYWEDHCIRFAVQRDGSVAEDISADQLETLVLDGFQLWSDVGCADGQTPVLSSGSEGPITCERVEYNCNIREDNSNLFVFRDTFDSASRGMRGGVIALTTLTANLTTGELFDADVEINSRDEDFELDENGNTGVNPDDPRDLRGVINHELGHFLGLSHSEEAGALMRAAYEGTFAPGADDIEAMCQALGTGPDDPSCSVEQRGADTDCLGADTTCTSQSSVTSEGGGCACGLVGVERAGSTRGAGPGLAGIAALGLAATWRLRRRARVRR